MRNHEHELHAEIARKKLRLAVFGAVDKNELNILGPGLENMYRQHEKVLVPKSVTKWANNLGKEPTAAKKEFVMTIFEKDIEIAEKYKKGIDVAGQIITLSDVRREEYVEIINLQNRMSKRLKT